LLFLPYLAIASVGYPIIVERFQGIIEAFINATASLQYWAFVPFTDDISVNEKLVVFGGFSVKIIDECTGIYEMLIFGAAVLAFPTEWSKKFTGILMGCPLIYLFNVVRIAMLIVVGRYFPDAFNFMHLYFWQATMIVMITSVWLLWIIKVVRSDEDDSAVPA
jgi:archaeosortase B (VPXXXP-CTERM-specific)